MNRSRIALETALFVLCVCLTGCLSDDQWTFGLSRAVYEEPDGFDSYTSNYEPGESRDGLPVALMLVLPLVLDILLLPVALTRDLIVLGWP